MVFEALLDLSLSGVNAANVQSFPMQPVTLHDSVLLARDILKRWIVCETRTKRNFDSFLHVPSIFEMQTLEHL